MVSSVSTPARVRRHAFLGLVSIAVVLPACSSPTGPTTSRVTVTSVSPSRGTTGGGTTITITGSGFTAGATVAIGGVQATGVSVRSATSVTAVTPVRAGGGPSDVTVTVGGTSASLAGGFTYVAPSGANQPPVVTSIRSIGSRTNQPSGFADAGETVTLVATATDADTSPDLLAYEWTGPGSFTGTGSRVSWTAPSTLASMPAPAAISLKVTETFTEGDVTHRNVTTAGFVVSVHDSQTEIFDIGEDFLTLFSHSELTTDQVLHNFSTTCDRGRGRGLEAEDVDRAHRQYVQDFSKFRISRLPPVQIRFGTTFFAFDDPRRPHLVDAAAQFQVHWEITYIIDVDSVRRKGTREVTDGVDYVTAALENDRWRLCSSDFQGISVQTLTGIRRAVSW